MRPTARPSDRAVIVDHDPQKVGHAPLQENVPNALEITEDCVLQLGDKFAGGAYADIHAATMIRPGGTDRCQVAVKVLRYHGMAASPQQYDQTLQRIDKRLSREMEVWKRLAHPRITPLLAYAQSSSKLLPGSGAALISPYRENANLRQFLSKKPNADKVLLLKQVCEGLDYIHTFEPPIAHLDLKPENILINDNEEAELCDFGLAKALEDTCTGFTTSTVGTGGTLVYMAPEALNGESQTTASDIYGMGGVILDVMSGIPPWGQIPRGKVVMEVAQGRTPSRDQHTISGYDMHVVDEVWILMQWCWLFNPPDRPKALEVREKLSDLQKPGSTIDYSHVDLANRFEPPDHDDTTCQPLDGATSSLHSQVEGTAGHEDMSKVIERPERDVALQELAYAAYSRYDQHKNLDDLSEAIEYHRKVVDLRPLGHPERDVALYNLAYVLQSRYDRCQNPKDLSEAIKHLRDGVNNHSPGQMKRDVALQELGCALLTRYEQSRYRDDLSAAIEHYQEAVGLRPRGHPKRDDSLHGLASALQSRYERHKLPNDLSAAIKNYKEAVGLRPEGHPKRDLVLHDLASAFHSRYYQDSNPKDLLAAIKHYREAIGLRPRGHSKRDDSLYNLATALKLRYDLGNNPDDLSAAVKYFQEVLDLCPPGHPDHALAQESLANTLKAVH